MGDRILNDDCGYAYWDGRAPTEIRPGRRSRSHKVHTFLEPELESKFIDDVFNILERVAEFVWRRCVGMTEPGVIRSHQMISVGQQWKEGVELA